MLIITDTPNHPAVLSHKHSGYLVTDAGLVIHFDELLYLDDDNPEWPDAEPPFYYYWNKSQNYRAGISVSDVKLIYFKDDRIPKASI
jgi:hypothetical protein